MSQLGTELYAGGGMNRDITSQLSNSLGSKPTCMLPSLDLRIGKPIGTAAVPCLVTINWPMAVGTDHVTLSTGAQFLLLQHSSRYQSWAIADTQQQRTRVARANRKMRIAMVASL